MKENEDINFPPVGGGNRRKNRKFSNYWVYIIMTIAIIAIYLPSMNTEPVLTTWQKVRTEMIPKGDVSQLLLVSNKTMVRVYLKPGNIDHYSELKAKGFKNNSKGPHYYFYMEA